MRFEIEKTRLSTSVERPLQNDARITFHTEEALNVDEAARKFSRHERCKLVSDLATIGPESIATARRGGDLFLLRFSRASE